MRINEELNFTQADAIACQQEDVLAGFIIGVEICTEASGI